MLEALPSAKRFYDVNLRKDSWSEPLLLTLLTRADVLKIKWSNMTKLVRALEEKEWIGRHVPPHDRRSVELHVTGKGRRKIDAVTADMYASDREALAMLDDAEHSQLLVLLRKVAGWTPVPATSTEGGA